MNKRSFVLGIFVSLLLVGRSEDVQAQRPTRYYPARPILSPYLPYGRFSPTGLRNFYIPIRPATRPYQESVLQSQATHRSQLRQTLIDKRRIAEVVDKRLRERTTTGAGQPSAAAQFMDTSHFYSSAPHHR